MTSEKQLILFMCTSNTCRSPIAEAFAREYLKERGLKEKFDIASRGLSDQYEPPGSPASPQGVLVLRESYGLDISCHRSKLLAASDVERAFALVCATDRHRRSIIQMFPECEMKVHLFGRDIPDPWHQPANVYLACAKVIKTLTRKILENLLSLE
jgi:protein-tyrosine-phosphatase